MNDELAPRTTGSNIDTVGEKIEQFASTTLQKRGTEVTSQATDLVSQRNMAFLRHFDPRERARVQGEVAIIKDELAARKRILQLYNETQITATQEFFQTFLVKLKVRMRADVAGYVAIQLREVEKTVNDISAELEKQMDNDFERISHLKSAALRERREQDIDLNMHRTFDLINKVLEDFRAAADRQASS